MAQEGAASGNSAVIPEQRTAEPQQVADLVPPEPGPPDPPVQPENAAAPVTFDRLLTVAALTPAQACVIAERLLAAGHAHAVDGGDRAEVSVGAVTLTSCGDVEVSPPGPDGGTPLAELLGRLVRSARRLPAHPRAEQLLLLHRLEEVARAVGPDPAPGARDLAGALVQALGTRGPARVATQLAALVRAFAHVASGFPGRSTAGADLAAGQVASVPARAVPRRTTPPPPAQGRPARRSKALLPRRARGRRLAVAALVLAALLAASGYVVLRSPGNGVAESLGLGNHSSGTGTSGASRHPARHHQARHQPAQSPQAHRRRVVATLAARRAGPVGGVAVATTGACRPGALCPVQVTVRLRPAATSRLVGWRLGAARMCRRGITWSARTTVTAQPGWSTVHAASSVRVPRGRSLALVAVTTTPARAQSRPVPVPGSSRHC